MRNSKGLPIAALVLAAAFGAAAGLSWLANGEDDPFHLSELEIGLAAWSLTLAIYGVQGLVSVASEGEELAPGKSPPRLTDEMTAAIVFFAILLGLDAAILVFTITGDSGTELIGTTAGIGCLLLAFLLVFYKEAFLGDEAQLDERDDGIPW